MDISLRVLVSAATSSTAQDFPRISSTISTSQAWGGMPSISTSTRELNEVCDACAWRFQFRKNRLNPPKFTDGSAATKLLYSGEANSTRKSSGANT
jgi:hypothetical protein